MAQMGLSFLQEALERDYGKELASGIINGYKLKRPVTLRVNNIKSNIEEIKKVFDDRNVEYKEVLWYKDALILENIKENEIERLDIYKDGKIYLQSLSSMIPPIILAPKPNENILDMAAAPGGKTTQISSISKNEAMITACEKNKIRFQRLKYNIDKQRARVSVIMQDARKLDEFFSFDKILLDSPCSGSGTISACEDSFSRELIERSVKVQEELLRKAIRILKVGGEIIYSTCSILKAENEEIISKVLRNENVKVIPIDNKFLKGIPCIPSLIEGTICVAPTEEYEGFFISKLRKEK